VLASVVGSPEISISNSPSAIGLSQSSIPQSNSSDVTPAAAIMIKQSLSGRNKASQLRQAADALCGAEEAGKVLSDYLDAYAVNLEGIAARNSIKYFDQALVIGREKAEMLKLRMKSNNATVQEYTLITQNILDLSIKRQSLLSSIAKSPKDFNVDSLDLYLTRYLDLASDADAKESRAMSTNGWDFSVGVGKDFATGSTSLMLSAKISLGAYKSYSSSNDVKIYSRQALIDRKTELSYKITDSRRITKEILDGELVLLDITNSQIAHQKKTLADISGIETSAARNFRDILEFQLAVSNAQMKYSQEKINTSKEALLKF
jgi:hypothetical protein